MKHKCQDLASLNAYDIAFIVKQLRQDKVLALPTDTIYGLSCSATSIQALNKIIKIKNRPNNKRFILLVSDLKMACFWADIKKNTLKDIKKIWQEDEPTTFILKAQKYVETSLKDENGNISLRLPKSDFLIKIVKELGSPLISTSLNLSGQPFLKTVKNLEKVFPDNLLPDMVLDIGPLNGVPSKIIDYSGDKPMQIR